MIQFVKRKCFTIAEAVEKKWTPRIREEQLFTCTNPDCGAQSRIRKLQVYTRIEVDLDGGEDSFWETSFSDILASFIGEYATVSNLQTEIWWTNYGINVRWYQRHNLWFLSITHQMITFCSCQKPTYIWYHKKLHQTFHGTESISDRNPSSIRVYQKLMRAYRRKIHFWEKLEYSLSVEGPQ